MKCWSGNSFVKIQVLLVDSWNGFLLFLPELQKGKLLLLIFIPIFALTKEISCQKTSRMISHYKLNTWYFKSLCSWILWKKGKSTNVYEGNSKGTLQKTTGIQNLKHNYLIDGGLNYLVLCTKEEQFSSFPDHLEF